MIKKLYDDIGNEVTLQKIMNVYNINTDSVSSLGENWIKLEEYLNTELDISDKIILILYAEKHNLRNLADILGISYTTIRQHIKYLREKINNDLGEDFKEKLRRELYDNI